MEYADFIARAIVLYGYAHIGFVNAFNSLWMQVRGITSALSFDTKLSDRVHRISIYLPQDLD